MRDWEVSEVQTKWSNEFGSLVVEPVTGVMQVSSIFGKDLEDGVKFDVGTAEKIALITENRRCQIGVQRDWKCYLIVHTSPNTAAVVKVVSLEYTGKLSPSEEIARARTWVAV